MDFTVAGYKELVVIVAEADYLFISKEESSV
jgi:hypothetical protein